MTHFFYGKTYIFFISTSKWAICWLANRENGIWCWFWWRWIVKFTFLFSGCVCPVLFLIFCFVRIFYSLIVRLNDAKICVWWKCLWLLLFLFFLHIKFVLIYANEVLSALLIYSFFFHKITVHSVYVLRDIQLAAGDHFILCWWCWSVSALSVRPMHIPPAIASFQLQDVYIIFQCHWVSISFINQTIVGWLGNSHASFEHIENSGYK